MSASSFASAIVPPSITSGFIDRAAVFTANRTALVALIPLGAMGEAAVAGAADRVRKDEGDFR